VTWAGVLGGALGCYLLKLAGLSVPERVLEGRRVQRIAGLLPVALLAALIATQTFSSGRTLRLDARAVGLAAAAAAVLLRAPFLVVVAVAAVTSALLRLL
jgi:branched-subunit amino acid transport protein